MDHTQQENAAALRALHVGGDPLVLPNAWDAASARVVEAAGFPVVATSSAAMSAVLGYDDGEAAPVADVLAAVARIVRAVSVPVTVDFERGFRLAPAQLVERLGETGAAGLNLEDSDPSTGTMIDAAEQADFLAGVRIASASAGLDLVINARIDSFLRRDGSPDDQFDAAIDRAARYLAAGADCIYPITVTNPQVIRRLVERIAAPVNVGYGTTGALRVADLAALGVARISFGPTLQRQVYAGFGSSLLAAVTADTNPFATSG